MVAAIDQGTFLENYADSDDSLFADGSVYLHRGLESTLLHRATLTCQLDVVKFLVRKGAPLDALPRSREEDRRSFGLAVQTRCLASPPKESASFDQLLSGETPLECVKCGQRAAVFCLGCNSACCACYRAAQ